MTYILTVVAQREATSLTPALLNHIRNAVRGAPPVVLSGGEAADIPLSVPLDPVALRDALDGKPVDAIVTKARGRRKALLIADMDSTIVTGETLDELAGFAGIGDRIAAITRARDERGVGFQGGAARTGGDVERGSTLGRWRRRGSRSG